MWSCKPTIPGMTVWLGRSSTLAPAGTCAAEDPPTDWIRRSAMTIVWSLRTGPPEPSKTRTWVRATTGASTLTNSRTLGDRADAACPNNAAAYQGKAPARIRIRRMDHHSLFEGLSPHPDHSAD